MTKQANTRKILEAMADRLEIVQHTDDVAEAKAYYVDQALAALEGEEADRSPVEALTANLGWRDDEISLRNETDGAAGYLGSAQTTVDKDGNATDLGSIR